MKYPKTEKRRKTSKKLADEIVSQVFSKIPSGFLDQQDLTCSVCLFDIQGNDNKKCKTVCNHDYHQHCLLQWLSRNPSCCVCRQAVVQYSCQSKGRVQVQLKSEDNSSFGDSDSFFDDASIYDDYPHYSSRTSFVMSQVVERIMRRQMLARRRVRPPRNQTSSESE